jgi:methylmalonyl-CoA/ethylmalonyl-CoA epimerase
MLRLRKIDHVAVVAAELEPALERWQTVTGLPVAGRELVAEQRTEMAMLSCGETSIELLAPAGNRGLSRFLERHGPGLHHIAAEVDDLDQALAALRAAGVPLIDEVGRPGGRGHRVAFVHPRALGGVLLELVERG